jgi:hypothetical protein
MQPTKFDLVISLKNAKTLGLKFQRSCSPLPTRRSNKTMRVILLRCMGLLPYCYQ